MSGSVRVLEVVDMLLHFSSKGEDIGVGSSKWIFGVGLSEGGL